MAGMISMLNNRFYSDGPHNGNLNSSWDHQNGGRGSSQYTLTPVLSGRKHSSQKIKHFTRTPKYRNRGSRFHKRRRIPELHPSLRRGVCTMITSGFGLAVGISLIVVDQHVLQMQISIRGWIIVIISIFFCAVGLLWFKFSQIKLSRKKEKRLHAKLKKAEDQSVHNRDIIFLSQMSSHNTAKWPTRTTHSPVNCRLYSSSPNGNRYDIPHTSVSRDSDEDASNSETPYLAYNSNTCNATHVYKSSS